MSDSSAPIAACSPEVNAVVAASAGTGKTYLLVTRIIRLLLAGAAAERILALTFTRKAAGEMRHRLQERLRGMSTMDDAGLGAALEQMGITPDNDSLDRARRLYEGILLSPRPLRISTFHAFCQQLLQRFPLEADVPPGYELLQSGSLVQTAAWDALFLEATRHPETDTARALETLFSACNGRLDTIRATLMQGFLGRRNDWLAYTQDRQDPVNHACDRLRRLLQLDDREPLSAFFGESGDELRRFRDLLLRHANDTNLEHAALIDDALNHERARESRFESVKTVFLTQKLEPRQRKRSKALEKALSGDADEFLQLHDILCRRILDAHEALLRREYCRTVSAWYRAGDALLRHYQRIKQEQRLLDFDDLEWKSYRLLHHKDHSLWVQYKIDQKIDHLLIDEFQDTNPTQWRLMLPLLEEMADAANPERSRSIFLVGDGKQSIYGFRRADPRLQEAAGSWLLQHAGAREFALAKSRRSAEAIMHTLNLVFQGTAIGENLRDFREHASHRDELWGLVEILPCVEPVRPPAAPETAASRLRDPLTTPRASDAVDGRYLEGCGIARRIHEIIDGGYAVEKGGASAPADYDDIFILFRTRTHIADYEQALTDHAIPFASLEKGTLLEQQEVEDIEALLNVLLTPFNNLALAQILKSPLFDASDADLMRLSALPGDWYSRLKTHAETATAADASPALLRAWRLLASWRSLLPVLPLHDLLDRIFHEGDILARYRNAAPPILSNRVTSNLQRLLALALEIDSGRYPSLSNFLIQLKRIRACDQDQPDTAPLPSGERKVRLMTIHAAKGLEAPIVFVADACSGARVDAYQALVDWPHTADRPEHLLLYTSRAQMPSVLEPALERQRQRQLREQANLLYVALSRAKQMLFISGSRSGAAKSDDWYGSILQALRPHASELPDGGYRLVSGNVEQQPRRPIEISVPEVNPVRELPLLPLQPRASGIAPAAAAAANDSDIEISTERKLLSRRHGTVVHKLLEFLSEPGALPAAGLETFLDYGINHEHLAAWRQEAVALLTQHELQFLFDPAHYDKAYKEIPLVYRTGSGETVSGIIDRVVIRKDEIWIIDYKTRAADDDRSDQALLEHYRPQLDYYTRGLQKIWPGKRLRPAILLTGSGTLLEIK